MITILTSLPNLTATCIYNSNPLLILSIENRVCKRITIIIDRCWKVMFSKYYYSYLIRKKNRTIIIIKQVHKKNDEYNYHSKVEGKIKSGLRSTIIIAQLRRYKFPGINATTAERLINPYKSIPVKRCFIIVAATITTKNVVKMCVYSSFFFLFIRYNHYFPNWNFIII